MYETAYTYDTDYANPLTLPYPTRNNRLLSYAESTDGVPTRTVSYSYYVNGDASNVTIRDVGDVDAQGRQIARDLALYYNRNGMLSLAFWGTWSESDGVFVAGTLVADTAREFRYDAARQRYASIPLTRISGTAQQPCFARPADLSASTWTDYVGDMPYTDFQADLDGNGHGVATTLTRHFLNSEQNGAGVSKYFHGDLLGSAVLATDSAGAPLSAGAGVAKLAYTAFGEEIAVVGGNGTGAAAMPTRYRYVGGYGYEADWLVLDGMQGSAPVTLQHVGYRWYQPNTGRFVQRDPLGRGAGANVYLYCTADPVAAIDPSGLAYMPWSWPVFWGAVGGSAASGATRGALASPPAAVASGAVGAVAGAAGYTGAWTVLCVGDILDILDKLGAVNERNQKERESRPDVFPPPPPPPPWRPYRYHGGLD